MLTVSFLYALWRLLFSFTLLGRSLDLRIQPHEMVIDRIFLPSLRSLFHSAFISIPFPFEINALLAAIRSVQVKRE